MTLQSRYVVVGAASFAYVIASQWLMTRTPPSPWSAVALMAPMLGVAAVGTWRSRQRAWSLLAAVALGALTLQAVRGRGPPPERLYLTEHVAIHVFLAISFGLTLRPGAWPLISRLAHRVHDGLTPAMERYTRKLTAAWTIYFGAMAALSIGLYAAAPFAVWAMFANLLTPAAMMMMFVGEYLMRKRLHPEFEKATLHDMIRAYAQSRRPALTPPTDCGPIR